MEAFARFKALADKKKEIFDEDLIALVDDEIQASDQHIKVLELDVHCGSRPKSLAAITLEIGGERREAQAQGDGPVDATFNAIKQLVPHSAKLALFQIHAVTEGPMPRRRSPCGSRRAARRLTVRAPRPTRSWPRRGHMSPR